MKNKKNILFYLLKDYKYIIFDLDNTIYDFRDYDYGAIKEVYQFLKIKIDKSDIIRFINYRQKKLFKKNLIDKHLEKINIKKNLIKKSISIFKNHNCKYINKKNSLRPLIKKLKNNRKKLFIISNGEEKKQNKKINKLKIKRYFEQIIICPPIEKRLKPHKFGFQKILRKKMNLEDFVMVGDSEIDKKFAKNCKIKFIKFKISSKNYDKIRLL